MPALPGRRTWHFRKGYSEVTPSDALLLLLQLLAHLWLDVEALVRITEQTNELIVDYLLDQGS